jgi:hypothetical protein
MSMIVNTGDDVDEVEDDDLERDDDDDRDDEPRPKSKAKAQDDDEPDDDDEDKSPEELKAEVTRLRASLAKANSSGNRRRQQLKELRAAQKAADASADDDDESDDEEEKPKQKPAVSDARQVKRQIDKAVKKREQEIETERTRDLIDLRFETKLAQAGVDEKGIRLLMREVDVDELDVDLKNRKVEGVSDEIDRLRLEYPALFRGSKGTRRRINGGDDRDTTPRKGKAMSATEKQVAMLEGRG